MCKNQTHCSNVNSLLNNAAYHLRKLFFSITLMYTSISYADYGGMISVPDPKFERALIELGVDADKHVNGLIDPINILEIKELLLANKGIYDLTGLEAFTQLEILDISDNKLDKLDVSNLLHLKN
jgi:hypothetical protein